MGDLTDHFSRWEFACKCGCGMDTVDWEVLSILEELHDDMGNVPITITSGCRCHQYNLLIKGSKRSQHMESRAADLALKVSAFMGPQPTELQGEVSQQSRTVRA